MKYSQLFDGIENHITKQENVKNDTVIFMQY